MDFLEKILSCNSVAGNTENMRELLKNELSSLFDNVKEDIFGSCIFTKKFGEGKKLMLCTSIETTGVIVCYADKSVLSLSPLGNAKWANFAHSKVQFKNVSGNLIPPSGYSDSTPLTDFSLETYDEKAYEKVSLGESGFICETPEMTAGDICHGFGAAIKMCIYSLCKITQKLSQNDFEALKELGIGQLCVAFIGQESLLYRGSSSASYDFDPNFVINLSPYNLEEKNVGSFGLEDGFLIKMLDKGFVASEEVVTEIEKLSEVFGVKTGRCVSNSERSSLSRLTLGCGEKGCAELCIPAKHFGTRGEAVKKLL